MITDEIKAIIDAEVKAQIAPLERRIESLEKQTIVAPNAAFRVKISVASIPSIEVSDLK